MPAPTSKRSKLLTLALLFLSSFSMVRSPSFTNTWPVSANSLIDLRRRPSIILATISGGLPSASALAVSISRSFATMLGRRIRRRQVTRAGRNHLHGEVSRQFGVAAFHRHQRGLLVVGVHVRAHRRRRRHERHAAHVEFLADLRDQRATLLVDRLTARELEAVDRFDGAPPWRRAPPLPHPPRSRGNRRHARRSPSRCSLRPARRSCRRRTSR